MRFEGHIVQNSLARFAFSVTERNVFKSNRSLKAVDLNCSRSIRSVFGLVEDFEESFSRGE